MIIVKQASLARIGRESFKDRDRELGRCTEKANCVSGVKHYDLAEPREVVRDRCWMLDIAVTEVVRILLEDLIGVVDVDQGFDALK
jgi:hypothetical protein